MNYIIDTHVLLWFIDGDNKIGEKSIQIITNDKLFGNYNL
jgi:PIN domain nuclease of toxin-antitoxin system